MPNGPDWSGLPPELLLGIARKLGHIADFARFRAVCPSWRRAAAPGDLPPNCPWLLVCSDPRRGGCHFYSLSADKFYTLRLPDARGKRFFGSSHGRLVIARILTGNTSLSLSLLNPFTGTHLHLPPLISDRLPDAFPLESFRGSVFVSGSDYLVASSIVACEGFAFCRPIDGDWTAVPDMWPCGLTFHKGKFISFPNRSTGATIDAATLDVAQMPELPAVIMSEDMLYLSVTASSELLLVLWVGKFVPPRTRRARFRVFRLDEGKRPEWIELQSIGDGALFVDSYNAIYFAACSDAGVRGNCIYFTMSAGICAFDMGDGTVEQLPYRWGTTACEAEHGTWFTPTLC